MQYSSTEGRNYVTVAPDRAVPLNMDADGYDFPEGAYQEDASLASDGGATRANGPYAALGIEHATYATTIGASASDYAALGDDHRTYDDAQTGSGRGLSVRIKGLSDGPDGSDEELWEC